MEGLPQGRGKRPDLVARRGQPRDGDNPATGRAQHAGIRGENAAWKGTPSLWALLAHPAACLWLAGLQETSLSASSPSSSLLPECQRRKREA